MNDDYIVTIRVTVERINSGVGTAPMTREAKFTGSGTDRSACAQAMRKYAVILENAGGHAPA